MSLAALAVRYCAVQALRGRTLAGDRVEDSPSDPIGLATSANGPVISVSSDHEVLRPQGRSFLMGVDDAEMPHANTVDLTFFVFLPGKAMLPVPGQPDAQIDVQQAGAAFAFDLMWRQITRALSLEDGDAPADLWSDLWRRAVNSVLAVEHSTYVGQLNNDVHVPAREIVMRLDVLDEPAFGALRSSFWPDFVGAVKLCDDLADVAPVIEQAVLGDDVPEWRALAALLGLRPADMVDVSLGPLGGRRTDPIVPMAAAAFDGRDAEVPDGSLVVSP